MLAQLPGGGNADAVRLLLAEVLAAEHGLQRGAFALLTRSRSGSTVDPAADLRRRFALAVREAGHQSR